MTLRLSTLLWIFILAMAALGLYAVKYKVQDIRQQVADTTRALKAEREALHVISAEWAYLSRPARLRALAQKHLNLEPVSNVQMIELARLPMPAAPQDGAAMAAVSYQPAPSMPSGGMRDEE